MKKFVSGQDVFTVMLLALAPLAFIGTAPIAIGFVCVIGAVSLAMATVRTSPGETAFISRVFGPAIGMIATAPAIWMILQLVPSSRLENPIWQSASEALDEKIVGTITVDPGATLLSLAYYLSLVAMALAASLLSVDRARAGRILTASMIATTVIALTTLLQTHLFPTLLKGDLFIDKGVGADCAALGIIFSGVSALRDFDRAKENMAASLLWRRFRFAMYALVFCVCVYTVFIHATAHTLFSAACGILVFGGSVSLRRFRVGRWGVAAVISVSVMFFATIIYVQARKDEDVTLAFSDVAPGSLVNVTSIMLSDTGWAGTGAGTYLSLVPVYRDTQEAMAADRAPTAASAVAVEMGKPFFWAVIAAAGLVTAQLLRGVMGRRRDEFYSAAAAGAIIMAILLAFGDSTVLIIPVSVLIALTTGVGLAQSRTRALRQLN